MQVFKIHCSHSLWRYCSACIYPFPTKCFSSGLLGKDIPGIVKRSSSQHRTIGVLNEFVASRTWDSYGRTDYFLSKTGCPPLRSSGVQGHFTALTIVFTEVRGRTGYVGLRMFLREYWKHLRMYFSCPQCIAAVALPMFLSLVLEELSQSPNRSSMWMWQT